MATVESLKQIQTELASIANHCSGKWGGRRVVIEKSSSTFKVHTHLALSSLLPLWLQGYLAYDKTRQDNRSTMRYFEVVFGQKRVLALSKRAAILWDERRTNGVPLTCDDIAHLFLQVANLQTQEPQDLWQSMHTQDDHSCGRIGDAARKELFEKLKKPKQITDLTRTQWNELHNYLVPFEKITTIFLDRTPTFEKTLFSEGAKIHFLRDLYVREKAWREEVDEDVWAAWLAKIFAKRQEGKTETLYPHPKGVLRLFGQCDSEQADFLFFKSLTKGLQSIVKIEGMGIAANVSGLIAMKEGLNTLLGREGMKRIEGLLKFVLGKETPQPRDFGRFSGTLPQEERFSRAPDEQFTAVTYSMGGAVASQFAIANRGIFNTLKLVSSPGIDPGQCAAYAQREDSDPIEITHIMEPGDVITEIGTLFGKDCKPPKKVRLVVFADQALSREQVKKMMCNPKQAPRTILGRIIAFFKGFTGPHFADTTIAKLGKFKTHTWTYETEEGRQVIQKVSERGPWEKVREDMQKDPLLSLFRRLINVFTRSSSAQT